MRQICVRTSAVLLGCLAISGCSKHSPSTTQGQTAQSDTHVLTLQCKTTQTDTNTGTHAAIPVTSTTSTDYYKIDMATKKVYFWDDESDKFVDVCQKMKCETSISDSQIYWKRELPEKPYDSLIVIHIEGNTISRSTGTLTGNSVSAIYKNMVPLRNSQIKASGKCEKSDFNGRKLKF